MDGNELTTSDGIQNHIYTVRGLQVMLDSDLPWPAAHSRFDASVGVHSQSLGHRHGSAGLC